MSKKKEHHEEHVDETWLIPYADMLTLLLALFIVMFAMSQVDKEKLERISNQFNIIFSGGSGIFDEAGDTFIPLETPAVSKSNSATEESEMNEVKKALEKEISSKGYSDKVKVELNKEGLEISIQDVALFRSGDDKVIAEVFPLLIQISHMLDTMDNDIKVVGHTDNIPINTDRFRSNWDLSAHRAINVMSFLVDKGGLKAERFSIQGYGQFNPKYDNATEEGKAKNRRVEIFVVRKYPSDEEKKVDIKEKTSEKVTETASNKH